MRLTSLILQRLTRPKLLLGLMSRWKNNSLLYQMLILKHNRLMMYQTHHRAMLMCQTFRCRILRTKDWHIRIAHSRSNTDSYLIGQNGILARNLLYRVAGVHLKIMLLTMAQLSHIILMVTLLMLIIPCSHLRNNRQSCKKRRKWALTVMVMVCMIITAVMATTCTLLTKVAMIVAIMRRLTMARLLNQVVISSTTLG